MPEFDDRERNWEVIHGRGVYWNSMTNAVIVYPERFTESQLHRIYKAIGKFIGGPMNKKTKYEIYRKIDQIIVESGIG